MENLKVRDEADASNHAKWDFQRTLKHVFDKGILYKRRKGTVCQKN